jgi:hypothetical protein
MRTYTGRPRVGYPAARWNDDGSSLASRFALPSLHPLDAPLVVPQDRVSAHDQSLGTRARVARLVVDAGQGGGDLGRASPPGAAHLAGVVPRSSGGAGFILGTGGPDNRPTSSAPPLPTCWELIAMSTVALISGGHASGTELLVDWMVLGPLFAAVATLWLRELLPSHRRRIAELRAQVSADLRAIEEATLDDADADADAVDVNVDGRVDGSVRAS